MCNDDPPPLHQDISFQVRASVHLFHARRLREIFGHQNQQKQLRGILQEKSGDFYIKLFFSIFAAVNFFWMMIGGSETKHKKKGGWTSRDYIAISHQSHKDWCFFHMSVSSFFMC